MSVQYRFGLQVVYSESQNQVIRIIHVYTGTSLLNVPQSKALHLMFNLNYHKSIVFAKFLPLKIFLNLKFESSVVQRNFTWGWFHCTYKFKFREW